MRRPCGRRWPTCSCWTAKRSRTAAWDLPPAQERDLPLPAGPGAHRAPRRRLAGLLVARRPGRAAPARPGRRREAVAELARRRLGYRGMSVQHGPGAPAAAPDGGVAQPTWPHSCRADRRRGPDPRPGRLGDGAGDGGRRHRLQLAGFLVALRAKGETVDELAGLADAMLGTPSGSRSRARRRRRRNRGRPRPHRQHLDHGRAGRRGGRASGGQARQPGGVLGVGAADVLEALGVRLDLPAPRVAQLADEVGITFCFAQLFHPAFRHAAVARRELGVPTAFNFLGPLTNPAQPPAAAVGVADSRMAPIVAGVLAGEGRRPWCSAGTTASTSSRRRRHPACG